MIINIPNIISLIRVLIAPFFFYLLAFGGDGAVEISCFLYFIASTSDYLDGWIARRYQSVSNWGKFLDPLADKILTTAAFAAFVMMGIIELWMVVIVLIRDFGTTFLRIYANSVGLPIKTSRAAKWKTFLQMIFIAYILILLLLRETTAFTQNILSLNSNVINALIYSPVIYILMLLLALMTIWTAIEYVVGNENLMNKIFNRKK